MQKSPRPGSRSKVPTFSKNTFHFSTTKKLGVLLLPLFLLANLSFAQHLVTGVVKDGNGSPLPGANVSVRGTSSSITTDSAGNFSIKVDI